MSVLTSCRQVVAWGSHSPRGSACGCGNLAAVVAPARAQARVFAQVQCYTRTDAVLGEEGIGGSRGEKGQWGDTTF